jgi:hypothetical protein
MELRGDRALHLPGRRSDRRQTCNNGTDVLWVKVVLRTNLSGLHRCSIATEHLRVRGITRRCTGVGVDNATVAGRSDAGTRCGHVIGRAREHAGGNRAPPFSAPSPSTAHMGGRQALSTPCTAAIAPRAYGQSPWDVRSRFTAPGHRGENSCLAAPHAQGFLTAYNFTKHLRRIRRRTRRGSPP